MFNNIFGYNSLSTYTTFSAIASAFSWFVLGNPAAAVFFLMVCSLGLGVENLRVKSNSAINSSFDEIDRLRTTVDEIKESQSKSRR
jgi:hypothetical protein